MLPKEIFLSHSNLNRKFANSLVNVLQSHGLPVWYSHHYIEGAQQWHDEIGSALKRCDWFIIILSPASVKSLWVKRELLFALQQPHYVDRIVPLLYKLCDYEKLSWTLSLFQFVDFTKSHETGFRKLLNIWGIKYKP